MFKTDKSILSFMIEQAVIMCSAVIWAETPRILTMRLCVDKKNSDIQLKLICNKLGSAGCQSKRKAIGLLFQSWPQEGLMQNKTTTNFYFEKNLPKFWKMKRLHYRNHHEYCAGNLFLIPCLLSNVKLKIWSNP